MWAYTPGPCFAADAAGAAGFAVAAAGFDVGAAGFCVGAAGFVVGAAGLVCGGAGFAGVAVCALTGATASAEANSMLGSHLVIAISLISVHSSRLRFTSRENGKR
jgi:hypothetical protein